MMLLRPSLQSSLWSPISKVVKQQTDSIAARSYVSARLWVSSRQSLQRLAQSRPLRTGNLIRSLVVLNYVTRRTSRCAQCNEKLIQWRGGEFIDETSESWLQLHGAICLRRHRSLLANSFLVGQAKSYQTSDASCLLKRLKCCWR